MQRVLGRNSHRLYAVTLRWSRSRHSGNNCLHPSLWRARLLWSLVVVAAWAQPLSPALVSQGCHVLLNYQFSSEEAIALQQRLHANSGQITLVQGDASDVAWCRQLQRTLTQRGQALDILICNAAPAIRDLGFALESVDRIRAFVDKSLALVSIPIAGFLDWLESRNGQIVLISSVIVSSDSHIDPANRRFLADFPHYTAAKFAIEGLVRAVAAQAGRVQFLIIRPPRLLTDQTNTVTGREGTIAVEGIAAKIVKRLRDSDGPTILEFTDAAIEARKSAEAVKQA